MIHDGLSTWSKLGLMNLVTGFATFDVPSLLIWYWYFGSHTLVIYAPWAARSRNIASINSLSSIIIINNRRWQNIPMESQFQLNKHTLSQWWVSQYMVKVVLLPASKVLRESKNPHPMAAVDSLSTQTCSKQGTNSWYWIPKHGLIFCMQLWTRAT